MKTISISRAVIVGVFIFLGIAIFVAAVFTIESQKKTFAKSVSIKVIFENVGGLQTGNNVWLSGVKVGTVKKISFSGDTGVEITLNVEKEAQSHISKDARAKISSDGFIGNKIVLIYGGTPSGAKISGGEYLRSEKSLSTDDMLSTLQENNKNLLAITGDLKVISRGIREGKGTVGELLKNPSIANKIDNTLTHFKTASINSEKAIDAINEVVNGFKKEGTLVNQLITDTSLFLHFSQTIDTLKEASAAISDFANNLKQAGGSLNKTDNLAGTLLNDQQVANDLKSITKNLSASSEKLDEDLRALQDNFLFRGYFKKQEKQRKKQEAANKSEENK
ncbi:MAG: MlaD family protein [Chitinophagales bacterium]